MSTAINYDLNEGLSNNTSLVSISREMSLKVDQFARALPEAISGSLRVDNSSSPRFKLTYEGKPILIECQQKPPRYIGSLTIPMIEIQINFSIHNSEQTRAFMALFDRAFLKMGG